MAAVHWFPYYLILTAFAKLVKPLHYGEVFFFMWNKTMIKFVDAIKHRHATSVKT